MGHSESCKKCKTIFLKSLKKEYGKVIEQWKPGWSCRIDDILALPEIDKRTANLLENIYISLQNHRGYDKIVGVNKLPACDYYIPFLNRIVEIDESQHFTTPRAITLSEYSKFFSVGFNKNEWKSRCERLNRHDNHPPHRDETRAWYDTLRDILPQQFGMHPTVRIIAKDMVLCKESVKLTTILGGI